MAVRRRVEFLAGRRAAALALVDQGASSIRVTVGAAGEPRWPPGWTGSIAHVHEACSKKGLALAAVRQRNRGGASAEGVGVDVENLADADQVRAMERLVIRRDEDRALQRLGLDRRSALTVVFSAKESFFKAAFPRVARFFDFDALVLVGVGATGRRLRFRIRRNLAIGLPAGRIVEVDWCRLQERVITGMILPFGTGERVVRNCRCPAQARRLS